MPIKTRRRYRKRELQALRVSETAQSSQEEDRRRVTECDTCTCARRAALSFFFFSFFFSSFFSAGGCMRGAQAPPSCTRVCWCVCCVYVSHACVTCVCVTCVRHVCVSVVVTRWRAGSVPVGALLLSALSCGLLVGAHAARRRIPAAKGASVQESALSVALAAGLFAVLSSM